jgi:hypothetical protein
VFSDFHDRLGLVLSLQLLRNYLIPKSVVVVIEVNRKVCSALFPFKMQLRRFRVRGFIFLDHGLAFELFPLDFSELYSIKELQIQKCPKCTMG